eukprot:6401026-Pyramimonas_sp.AAC.1
MRFSISSNREGLQPARALVSQHGLGQVSRRTMGAAFGKRVMHRQSLANRKRGPAYTTFVGKL